MNGLFSSEYFYSVYAKNKAEAIAKVTPIIEKNTRVVCGETAFIELADPQLDDAIKHRQYAERLLKTNNELNNKAKNYPIGYFCCTNMGELERTEIVGATVEKVKQQHPPKFVTAFQVHTYETLRNGDGILRYIEKEAINLAEEMVKKGERKVYIHKVKVLEDGSDHVSVATITPKKKHHYNSNKLYSFFGIDGYQRARYV